MHRAVSANSSPLHPSISPREDACFPGRRAWRSGMRRCACAHQCYVRACVAFATVILNIRRDISILVGKHTNSGSAIYSRYGAYILVPRRMSPAQPSRISRRGSRKMPSLRLVTGVETCRSREHRRAEFPRGKRDFSKPQANSTVLNAQPNGRIHVDRDVSLLKL